MVSRPSHRSITLLVLLAGFALRAITPLGYMPAAAGNGLLFELCPDQLPPGIELPGIAGSQHHHHHGANEPQTGSEADQCQLGHLIFSALAVDEVNVTAIRVQRPLQRPPLIEVSASLAILSAYRSRAPPA